MSRVADARGGTGAALLLVFAVFFLATLGVRPLARPDEFRNAEIAREMVTSGDWVTPRLNGLRYFEKPVLGHWLNAASLSVFGTNAFAARLPSALATGLTSLFVFAFLRRLATRARIAFGSSWIQLTFVAVWGIGGIASLDSVLTLWLTMALGLYFLSYVARDGRERARLQAAVGVCCGLAFLTKGFLALAIPVLVVLPFLVWQRDWARLRGDAWIPIACAALVILPWGLLVHVREPDFWHYFFWEEHVRRFLSDDAQHGRPFWLFIAVLPAMALPWTFYAPAAWLGLRQPSSGARPLLRFTWLWFLMPLLFFSSSRGKLLPYILPCFPPLAILLSHGIAACENAGRNVALRRGALGTALFFGAGFVGLVGNGLGFAGKPIFGDAENARWIIALAACAWGAGTAVLVSRRSLPGGSFGLGASMLGVFLAVPFAFPDSARESALPGDFLAEQRALIAPDAVLIVNGGLVGSAAWVFQRSDLYVIDSGELRYGLSQPDAAGRKVNERELSRFIEANAGLRDVVVLSWSDDEERLGRRLPQSARRAQTRELMLWHIASSQAH